jgi:hypothetical protein
MGPVSITMQYISLCRIYGYNEYMNKGSGCTPHFRPICLFQFFFWRRGWIILWRFQDHKLLASNVDDMNWKGSGRKQYSPNCTIPGTEENHRTPQSGGPVYRPRYNLTPPEDKSRAQFRVNCCWPSPAHSWYPDRRTIEGDFLYDIAMEHDSTSQQISHVLKFIRGFPLTSRQY